ncbi:hypothetical protein AC1031_011256 [Aphanomyces cochlioides]|nr:hypothetical protein AC1031_011256 [Aphanomyces cochlioides]
MKEQFGLMAEYSLDNDYCWLVNGEVKIEFALVDGMYRHIAKLVKFRPRPVLYTSTPVEENKSELRKLHNRLAHANMDVVKAMYSNGVVHGMKLHKVDIRDQRNVQHA